MRFTFSLLIMAALTGGVFAETHYNTDLYQFDVFAEQWNKNAYAEFDLDFVRSFADVNGDLSVDVLDLMIVAENWTEAGTLYDIGNMYQQVQNTEMVNNAIQDYFQDHGHLPGNGNSDFIFSLTCQTDIEGNLIFPPWDPNDSLLGPYLDTIPDNYVTLRNMTRFDGAAAGAELADWRFDTITGIFESDYPVNMEMISFHRPGRFYHYRTKEFGPVNIFNGLNTIRQETFPYQQGLNTHGWIYDGELIADDTGIPTTPEGGLSEEAIETYRVYYFMDILSYIRSAIIQYRYDHHWQNPGQGTLSFKDALTLQTNEQGQLYTEAMASAGIPSYGPYLPVVSDDQFLPQNPFNGLHTVRVNSPDYGENTHGWYYETQTGYFYSDICTMLSGGIEACWF